MAQIPLKNCTLAQISAKCDEFAEDECYKCPLYPHFHETNTNKSACKVTRGVTKTDMQTDDIVEV